MTVAKFPLMFKNLVQRNEGHVNGLDDDCFEGLRSGQSPELVSVCCSDSRVSNENMWSTGKPGWIFTSDNIGNQVWRVVDGEKVVDGNLLYPVLHTDTSNVVVVGHTGCGAVTAAYRWIEKDEQPESPGVRDCVELLLEVVSDGLGEPEVTEAKGEDETVNHLVEYSVKRQVEFLLESDEIPEDVDIYGFVYDFQDWYGEGDGRAVPVSVNGREYGDKPSDNTANEIA
ncbi:MAG: carbonic anhydrase [Halobacteria archaeon]